MSECCYFIKFKTPNPSLLGEREREGLVIDKSGHLKFLNEKLHIIILFIKGCLFWRTSKKKCIAFLCNSIYRSKMIYAYICSLFSVFLFFIRICFQIKFIITCGDQRHQHFAGPSTSIHVFFLGGGGGGVCCGN